MTQNQINYARYLEEKRHNSEVEAETRRNNVATLTETNRHNVVYEQETNRHNVASEHNQSVANAINSSHFERSDATALYQTRIQEQHYLRSDTEQQRHNVQSERIEATKLHETSRHNVEQENIGMINANAAAQNATTNALAQGDQSSNIRSQIELRNEQIQDLESQQRARKVNTILNAVDTASESVRDVSTAAKNGVETLQSGLKLIPSVFNIYKQIPIEVLFN